MEIHPLRHTSLSPSPPTFLTTPLTKPSFTPLLNLDLLKPLFLFYSVSEVHAMKFQLSMAKKRKSVATRLDEVDRTIYTTFCSAANSLSQLFTQAMNQQKLSFQAGELHALEKLYQWILRQQEEGARVTTIDIVAYLQNELEYGAEESPMSPRQLSHHQHFQTATHPTNISVFAPSNVFSTSVVGQGIRSGQPEQQAKNSVFSNALASPICRSLQPYHPEQGGSLSGNIMSSGNGPRSSEMVYSNSQNWDTNSSNSSGCMDMHADSPGNDFPY